MLKKLLPSLAIAAMGLLAAPAAQAQHSDGWRPCGSAELQEQYFTQHPQARREYQQLLQTAAASLTAQRGQSQMSAPGDTLTDVVVPVVVHILYYNIPADNSVPASNVTDRQINDAMAILNRDFSRKNADTAAIARAFKSRVANPGFKFRLAKRDPSGNCTTGITRHYNIESDYGTANVTNIVYWDASKYLNLWITNDLSNAGTGGYTFGARDCNSNDGIVLRRTQFGPQSSNLPTRSLTHEVGHYFALPHTWGGSNTPGVSTNCGIDDGIADTPNTIGVAGGGCPTNMVSCGNLNNVQNYMDYAECESMFTTGQKAVMRTFLTTSACRRNLVSAANLVATGTNDGYVAVPCAPITFFNSTKTTVCQGSTVGFRSYTYNINASGNPTTYSWSFPGGTPATATTATATVTYPNAGVYPVSLTVTNTAGTNTYTAAQLIRVTGPASAEVAPFTDSFEDTSFPNYDQVNPQRNYTTFFTNPVSPRTYSLTTGWRRRSASSAISAADGTSYLVVLNSQYAPRTLTTLITPNINLSGITSPVLKFNEYYGFRTSASDIQLQVAFSTDCGTTWTQAASYSAAQLNLTATPATGDFPTSPADYREMQIPITGSYVGSPQFRVRFQMTNGTAQDNDFYFDKLQVTGPLGTHANALAQRGISIYPNPLTHETAVHLTLPASTPVQVRLTDVLGREVLTLPTKTYPAGEQAISLASAGNGLPAGVYVVRITLDGQTYTSKLAVQ